MQRKVLFYCLLLASLLEDKLCSEFVKFSFSFSSLFFLWHQARKRFEVCFLLQSKKAKKSNSGFCFVLLGGEIISIMQMTNKKKKSQFVRRSVLRDTRISFDMLGFARSSAMQLKITKLQKVAAKSSLNLN